MTGLIDNMGLVLHVSGLTDYRRYAELRDRLELMHPVRRALSFRQRRERERLHIQAMAAILNEVLEKADHNS